MLDYLTNPIVALFLSLALGHLLGRVRFGPVALGGVCGTLFVSLAIGQLGVEISTDLKDTAFALFIYALGFSAGPQFFANIKQGIKYGVFPLIEVAVALTLTMAAVVFFQLDPGTAAGLFAGSATESAVVGTASEAITRLGLSSEETKAMQSNIATAYSLTYLFGLVAIVIFVTQIAPLILRKDLKTEAEALAASMGAGDDEALGASLPTFVERAFQVGGAAGQTVKDFEEKRNWTVMVQSVIRNDKQQEAHLEYLFEPGDVMILRGRRNTVIGASKLLGDEVPVKTGTGFTVISKEVVLKRKEAFGQQTRSLRNLTTPELQRGIFVTKIRRLGQYIPALPKTYLQEGDVLTLYGPEASVERAVEELGGALPDDDNTDFVLLGLGIVIGLMVGHLSFEIGSLELTLGLGGGALVSGLFFGWLNMRYPRVGALPDAAAHFAKDFGLATFIAAIGLGAGPDAVAVIKEYGLIFPLLGIVLSIAPAFVSLFIGARFMKVPMPILLGAIAGQHCSTPALSAIVSQAGNATPVMGYTVTYAFANVLLPLMGPVVVGLAVALGGGAP